MGLLLLLLLSLLLLLLFSFLWVVCVVVVVAVVVVAVADVIGVIGVAAHLCACSKFGLPDAWLRGLAIETYRRRLLSVAPSRLGPKRSAESENCQNKHGIGCC